MTGSCSDGMHVAHTAAGWIVFDNSTSRRSRLSAPCHTRAEALTRKKSIGRALRRQHPDDAWDA